MVQDDPVVSSDAVAEAILRKLHGINRIPIDEQERMIHRAVLAGRDAAQKEHAARIAELERLTAMSVESLAYIRGIAEKGGEEEVPDSAPTHQAILGYVMFLEAQLAAAQEWERWIPISDGLPENIRPVLVRAQDKRGECFVLRAAYAHKRELEIDSDDYADGFADHDEDNGIDYCPEGWYEWNYTDEVHYYLGHLEITHWRGLPEPPKEE